ncbi:MAG: cytochrome c biogenesis protein CcdA, partial [Streptococcus mitis]|nr:cytochrome c biogenesis protein CcdA [Streptococcus mitis]
METIVFSISVFLAGVLSFFSPCIFPLLPVY